ncbi:MAG: polysaccharide pyruvyl transferase family protein [Candidatus Treponema excrementipullorum]|uniref:Polysaccharide pyruvyl transferase family protein n=1 Tax=Candidatus Treponema excrementipullorum TaxID=2838768 RepID=A0A9E2KZI5_9SPIR|nr:polysaccharide pyruvyl transferase family protein [Candidatus Treponema excrementipullorum]
MEACEKTYASIPKWLCFVDNAQYVITNSFHCCVFCILFRKQFGVIELTGISSRMNCRLHSLFEMTGCGAQYIKDGDFSVLDEGRCSKDLLRTMCNVLHTILEDKNE